MKLLAAGFCTLLLTATVGIDGNRSDYSESRNETTASVGLSRNASAVVNMAAFAEEVSVVERELMGTTGMGRDVLLARYGRSSAASGRFDHAAAAYAMFLDEFGTDHRYSERIAMRFADCLFPFKYSQVDVLHVASSPQLQPAWRMEFSPQPGHLREAVRAYELAASITDDSHAVGVALLKLGWVHRVLDDWEASTEAWDRCAHELVPTKVAADAIWLSAENLAWSGQPTASAERLRRLVTEHPGDDRVDAVTDRIEHLEAEAHRSSSWSTDPVASLKMEIEARSGARAASEVYRSAVKWLKRRGERAAMIAIVRWARTQHDWPADARIACRYDLVDALSIPAGDEADHHEAADLLGEIVDLASGDNTAVPAAIRRCRLLKCQGQFGEEDRVADEIAERVKGSRRWEPVVLTERIESLLERGDLGGAEAVFDALVESHPDYDVHQRFDAAFVRTREEGSK